METGKQCIVEERPEVSHSSNESEKYLIYNCTDGIFAYPEPVTLSQAREFIREFPKRFSHQGYYKTIDGTRIRPEAVRLEILDKDMNFVPKDEPDDCRATRGE